VFAAAVAADVAAGTWDVALRVLHLRHLDRPGTVRVPIGARTDRGVAVSALATTLSPGAVLVDVDWERREMLVHVIDASDPAAVCARLERFYDRFQRRVFP
jgi:multisubunit Na+/H+ antiporter MnhE subunit